jgi:hypothetical protein
MMNYRRMDLGERSTVIVFFAVISGVLAAATAVLPFVINA